MPGLHLKPIPGLSAGPTCGCAVQIGTGENGEFPAYSFAELFEKQRPSCLTALKGLFPGRGKSIRSKLFSVPDCQAIVKKAIVESMKKVPPAVVRRNRTRYTIEVALLRTWHPDH